MSRPWVRVVYEDGERVEGAGNDDGTDPADTVAGDRLYIVHLDLPRPGRARVWVSDGPTDTGKLLNLVETEFRAGQVSRISVTAAFAPKKGKSRAEPRSPAGPATPVFGQAVGGSDDTVAFPEPLTLQVGSWPERVFPGAASVFALLALVRWALVRGARGVERSLVDLGSNLERLAARRR